MTNFITKQETGHFLHEVVATETEICDKTGVDPLFVSHHRYQTGCYMILLKKHFRPALLRARSDCYKLVEKLRRVTSLQKGRVNQPLASR